MNSNLHYFTHSNIPRAVSYYGSNFASLEHTVRLSGYPRMALEEIFSSIALQAKVKDTPLHYIHHCLDNSIQGMILPEFSSGIFSFDVYDTEVMNYTALLNAAQIDKIQSHLSEARRLVTKARLIHDEQEKIYGAHMNFSAANRLTEDTLHLLLDGQKSTHTGSQVHRFFGAATIDGNINYVPEVTETIPNRYYMKGRPGTGKSTFLRKIADAAAQQGFDVEIYHCALDPDSLDLVAVRELGFCLFDSTSPHEYFPTRTGDRIIDIYQTCVTPGTDEKYQTELEKLQSTYKTLVSSAVTQLQLAKAARDEWNDMLPQVDMTTVEKRKNQILRSMFPTASN